MITLNPTERFQLSCLEAYKTSHQLTGEHALEIFEKNGVFDFLSIGFEVLHTQSLSYVISEIDTFIDNRK